MAGAEGLLHSLERRSSNLFLIGGAIVVLFAILGAISAFSDSSYPHIKNVLTVGYVLAFVGLIGLYRPLSENQKRLARIGVGAALLGAIGFSFNAILSLGQLGGLIPREAPAWTNAFVPLSIIGMIVGYLAIGTASLRSNVHSQIVGLLLLTPGTVFVILFVSLFTIGVGQWGFLFTGVEAVAILGAGIMLRTEIP